MSVPIVLATQVIAPLWLVLNIFYFEILSDRTEVQHSDFTEFKEKQVLRNPDLHCNLF